MSHIDNDENDTEGGLTESAKRAEPKGEAVKRYGLVGVAGGLAGCKNGCLSSASMVEQRNGHYVLASAYDAKCAEIATLTSQLAEAKRDAERYRFIRSVPEPLVREIANTMIWASGVGFDTAIDAQLALSRDGEGERGE